MKHSEGTFCGLGGLELFNQAWLPDNTPRAALAIVHGQGDHSGRFDRLVLPLAEHGFASYAYDQRGFGRSPGRKGHINAWAEYREDLRAFLKMIGEQQPGVPVFLFGYSMGTVVVLDYIIRDPGGLRGAILSGAAIEPAGVATPGRVMLAKLLSRIWPTFAISTGEDMTPVTRDVAIQEAAKTDRWHHSFVTVRWGTESMATLDYIRPRAAEIRLPVLFVHGEADPLVLVSGAKKFFDQIPYPDKTMKIYPGSKHETHNDLDHVQVVADIEAWMADHI